MANADPAEWGSLKIPFGPAWNQLEAKMEFQGGGERGVGTDRPEATDAMPSRAETEGLGSDPPHPLSVCFGLVFFHAAHATVLLQSPLLCTLGSAGRCICGKCQERPLGA